VGEFNIYGVYVPVFLIQAILAYVLLKIVSIGTDKIIEKGWIALPSIFNLCLYIILLWFMHWLFVLIFS
jgi:hypothetical protein